MDWVRACEVFQPEQLTVPTLYKIKDWEKHFENSRSREIDQCRFCAMPTKQDGLGYGRLIRMPNGPALYGAFVAVVLIAAKQKRPRKGYLTADGLPTSCPLTADDMSVKCQVPADIMQAMLTAAVSIGWMTCDESKNSADELPTECRQAAVERKKERKKEESEGALSLDPHIPTVKEVIDYCSMRGIPQSFCEHYHAVCTEKHRWIVQPAGKLIGWQSEIVRWWTRDRATWSASTPQADRTKAEWERLQEST
jgi:hypothetical protein